MTVIQTLVDLGFTRLEADIYVFLLQESPATGYRVAQAIGKPTANTYKAIQALESKGAVLVDENKNRLCRAVSANELLSQIERKFIANKQQAAKALSKLESLSHDDRVYQIRSRDQVFERFRNMLVDCRDIAILDCAPTIQDEVKPMLAETTGRGVKVAIKTYQPFAVRGALVFVCPRGEEIMKRWPGLWLNLIVDGAEHLFCYLSPNGKIVYQAIWSASAYLSWIHYGALRDELISTGIERLLQEDISIEELRRAYKKFDSYFPSAPLGYQRLSKRFTGRESK